MSVDSQWSNYFAQLLRRFKTRGNIEETMRKHLGVHKILLLIAVNTTSVHAYIPVDHDDKRLVQQRI